MKYRKMTDNICTDFSYWVSRENLFTVAFYGDYGTKSQKAKLNYIWKRLLKLHKKG